MKARQVSNRAAAALSLVVLGLLAVAGCSSTAAPKTLAEQQKAVQGTPIPPDINAKYAAMYGPNGSETLKIKAGMAAAGAKKQAATGQTNQPSKPAGAPSL